MNVRWLNSICLVAVATLVTACGGGGGSDSGGGGTPQPQPQTIAFTNAGPITSAVGTTLTNTASGGGGVGTITYISSNTTIATVSATTGVVNLLTTGSAIITATKTASSGFNQATATYSITVTPGSQVIAFAQAGPLNVLLGSITTNTASGGAGTGSVTYSSSNASTVIVNPLTGAANAIGAGIAVITATKAADANYLQAQATYSITVAPAAQVITFTQAGPFVVAPTSVTTNTASGGAGTGAVTYSSSNTSAVTVNPTSGAAIAVGLGTTIITATKAADTNYLQAQATYSITVALATQTIAFAQAGPVNVYQGIVTTNTASGGAGTGAMTYVSSDTNVVTVNLTSGAATAVGLGTAIITATKAADTMYAQAQASYTINSQTTVKISGFIGATGTVVNLPSSAIGKQFARARIADCLSAQAVPSCLNAEVTTVAGAPISDTRATLTTPAYYSIMNGATVGTPVEVQTNRFSGRIGHTAVYFNNRYWVIGGGEPIIPGSTPVQYTAKADVWSSADGRTWKLETTNGGFGARWMHQSVVFNNRIWIFSGSAIPAQSPLPWYADSWSSSDGVTWTQESTDLLLPWWSTTLNVYVANGELLAISGGRLYTYSQASHAFVKKTVASTDLTGSGAGRSWASLTFYNNQWWYIGGRPESSINTPVVGTAMNDVWRSSDGITWTQVLANGVAPFAPRYRHAAFVVAGKLWVWGGQASVNGVDGAVSADAWSTTDGVNWTQENVNGLARSYLTAVVQEPGKATLLGGLQVGFTSNVWQTSDGLNWSELSSRAQFSPRTSQQGVEFNGQMWLIGGFAVDGRIADRITNEVWRSSDGLNWSRVTPTGPIFSPRDAHGVVVFNNRLWVIGGTNNPTGGSGTNVRLNDVWSSADGATWRQETAAAAFTPRAGFGSPAFGGKLWVIGGCTSATACVNDVWSSTDGATWVNESSSATFSARGLSVTVFNNALWIHGGETAAGAAIDDAWRSTDGITWTSQSLGAHYASRTRGNLKVLNGRLYLVGGVSSSDYWTGVRYNDVWSSADGLTWQQETAQAAFAPRSLHSLIPYNNELWLIGGFGKDHYNDVWRSSDGINWRIGFSSDIASP